MQGKKIATMTFVWREEFATGIEELDDQHKAMFDKVNELVEAARSGLPREQVGELIRALHEGALLHFECEEGHMEARRCSVCAANKLAHREFLRDFKGLREQFEQHGVTLNFVDQVQERVGAWLTTHLLAMDIALRETVD